MLKAFNESDAVLVTRDKAGPRQSLLSWDLLSMTINPVISPGGVCFEGRPKKEKERDTYFRWGGQGPSKEVTLEHSPLYPMEQTDNQINS